MRSPCFWFSALSLRGPVRREEPPADLAALDLHRDDIVRGTKDIMAEVIPSPRATSPGSVVSPDLQRHQLRRHAIRVRLHTELPAGWTLLDATVEQQEYEIEALDEIDGEILVTAAKTAKPGDRQLVRLVAEVVGEEGVYEGQNFVSITRGGGLKPGAIGLTGTTTIGISRVSPARPMREWPAA